MAYRVYDKKKKRFINDNIYLTPDGELIESKKSLFGNKLTFVDQNRYVYQKSIDLNDKGGILIHVGDYVKAQVADDREITGLVTYAEELAAYIILCFDTDEYFVLSSQVCDRIQIVGNVFDEKKGKKNGEPN